MKSSTITNHFWSDIIQSTKDSYSKQYPSPKKNCLYRKTLDACQRLIQKPGIYSTITMESAGFRYTNNGDEVRCDTCALEVSGWILDMQPFTIHAQRSPTCEFVRSIRSTERIAAPSMITLPSTTSISSDEGVPSKRQKTEVTQENCQINILTEVEALKKIRKRTFSHWPHRTSPSSAQMIEAGFFGCNVGDRVICLYCNLICQQWTPHTDDACEVHKTLSPKCPYVTAMSTRSQISSIPIINEHLTQVNSIASTNNNLVLHDQIVKTAPSNVAFAEIPKRYTSFTAWPNDNLPSVDDLVRAGFFYTGTNTIVTCFYCNGSLQNWSVTDNPTTEHARWFPHCAYAKQLCGDEQHRKIQESNRRQKERNQRELNNEYRTNANSLSDGRSNIPDETILSRLVAARLDLTISQKLLDQNFKLSIIKRCWEDQLRLKREDFTSDSDLLTACIILRKQIEHIDGKKENIVIPSTAMNEIREREQAEILLREQKVAIPSSENSSNNTDVEMAASSETMNSQIPRQSSTSIKAEKQNKKSDSAGDCAHAKGDSSVPFSPCVLCLTEEKGLACIPCGHVATCVPCGHSLRSCPICRTKIDGFVRVYV